MARSLAKIQEQIEKLQKEADSIQSGIIARIKREIAQHGLTAHHLFGGSGTSVGNGRKAVSNSPKASAAKRRGAAKPAKYADGQGNAWGGLGKRPQWIHDALAAGRSLDEFLVASKGAGAAPKTADGTVKASRKVSAKQKRSPAKKAKAARAPAPAAKAPAKRSPKAAAAAKKSPARKAKVKAAASPDAGTAAG